MEKKNHSAVPLRKFTTLLKMIGILLSTLLFCATALPQSEWIGFRRKIKPIIAIDAGHGGHDFGGRGAAGTLEKNVTLALARAISAELGDRYQVILTRPDDYWLDINNRAAEANHAGADLFISLHVSGNFRFQVSGMAFYYYQAPPRNGTEETTESNGPPITEDIAPWEKLQLTHRATGKLLAETLQKVFNDHSPGMTPVKVLGLPLAALAGADMPAVLIEIGYLTNPPEEMRLCSAPYLTALSRKIANGIDYFFSQKR